MALRRCGLHWLLNEEIAGEDRSCLKNTTGTWSVAVEDVNEGTSFSLNGDESFYAASIIKVPIMAAVFAAAEDGVIRLGNRLPLQREDMSRGQRCTAVHVARN